MVWLKKRKANHLFAMQQRKVNSSLFLAGDEHEEIARFSARAQEWWVPQGSFQILHDLVPLRLAYIEEHCAAQEKKRSWKNVRVLDIGCGGGLMAEALTRLGASVVGIDASAPTIDAARRHAAKEKLALDYRVSTADDLAQTQERFDLVLAFEILEHVGSPEALVKAAATLLKPQGLLIASTLNRTRASFLLGVIAAEYVLSWVPTGTHDWDRFLSPSELAGLCQKQGLRPRDITGMPYSPLRRKFILKKGATKVNYFLTACKQP